MSRGSQQMCAPTSHIRTSGAFYGNRVTNGKHNGTQTDGAAVVKVTPPAFGSHHGLTSASRFAIRGWGCPGLPENRFGA